METSTIGSSKIRIDQVDGLKGALEQTVHVLDSHEKVFNALNEYNKNVCEADTKHKEWLFKHLNVIMSFAVLANFLALSAIGFILYTITLNHLK